MEKGPNFLFVFCRLFDLNSDSCCNWVGDTPRLQDGKVIASHSSIQTFEAALVDRDRIFRLDFPNVPHPLYFTSLLSPLRSSALNPRTTHYEFMGPPGAFFMILSLPLVFLFSAVIPFLRCYSLFFPVFSEYCHKSWCPVELFELSPVDGVWVVPGLQWQSLFGIRFLEIIWIRSSAPAVFSLGEGVCVSKWLLVMLLPWGVSTKCIHILSSLYTVFGWFFFQVALERFIPGEWVEVNYYLAI